jgi:ATP-dependent DNA ligase
LCIKQRDRADRVIWPAPSRATTAGHTGRYAVVRTVRFKVADNDWVTATLRLMLVSTGSLRPDSGKYAFEVKWDGFRALVDASPGGVTIASRNGYAMTGRYPELRGLRDAVSTEVLFDGEIVALDGDNKPDFTALWFHSRGSADPGGRLCFMAFDVLRLGDEP